MREAGARQLQARQTVAGASPCTHLLPRRTANFYLNTTLIVHVPMQVGGCCTPNGTMHTSAMMVLLLTPVLPSECAVSNTGWCPGQSNGHTG